MHRSDDCAIYVNAKEGGTTNKGGTTNIHSASASLRSLPAPTRFVYHLYQDRTVSNIRRGPLTGFLGWVAYLGAANAGVPLSIIVKQYGAPLSLSHQPLFISGRVHTARPSQSIVCPRLGIQVSQKLPFVYYKRFPRELHSVVLRQSILLKSVWHFRGWQSSRSSEAAPTWCWWPPTSAKACSLQPPPTLLCHTADYKRSTVSKICISIEHLKLIWQMWSHIVSRRQRLKPSVSISMCLPVFTLIHLTQRIPSTCELSASNGSRLRVPMTFGLAFCFRHLFCMSSEGASICHLGACGP